MITKYIKQHFSNIYKNNSTSIIFTKTIPPQFDYKITIIFFITFQHNINSPLNPLIQIFHFPSVLFKFNIEFFFLVIMNHPFQPMFQFFKNEITKI